MEALTAVHSRREAESSLVQRAQRGEPEAFAALIRAHDHGLRALAYRLLGDRDRMDDVLQETYLRAFRALPQFRGDASLATWLYRIAYNACLDALESERKLVRLPLAESAEHASHSVDTGEAVTARVSLVSALASLSVPDRAAVLLVDAEGFDYREAGAILGIPAGTVASRLNRARSALRRALDDDSEGAA